MKIETPRPPTEESIDSISQASPDLEPYSNPSMGAWDAVAESGAIRSADERVQALRVEQLERRARAVEGLTPSGDIDEDARGLLDALGVDVASLNTVDRHSFLTRDQRLITEYLHSLFQHVQRAPAGLAGYDALNHAVARHLAELLKVQQ